MALTSRHRNDLLQMTGMMRPVAALEDPLGVDFADETDRFDYREVLTGLLQRWFAERSVDRVTAALGATSLVWAPYRTFSQAVE